MSYRKGRGLAPSWDWKLFGLLVVQSIETHKFPTAKWQETWPNLTLGHVMCKRIKLSIFYYLQYDVYIHFLVTYNITKQCTRIPFLCAGGWLSSPFVPLFHFHLQYKVYAMHEF